MEERLEAPLRRRDLDGNNESDDDSSIEEIEAAAGAGAGAGAGAAAEAATDLDDFLLLLDGDDGVDGDDSGLSSVDPRSLAVFADVAAAAASNEDGREGEPSDDPFSDSYRGPGAIAAASAFAAGCLGLLRAFAASKELSARCRAVATAVIERVNSADYTAWRLSLIHI